MARRRGRHEDRSSRRRQSKPAPDPPSNLPDRRALERTLHELVGGQTEPDTAQGQAQELVYEAFEEDDLATRQQLVRQALELWPDCADAYVLLAEQARSRKEALALYEQGVAAGERALGPAVIEREAGHFWGILETRPYMRARLGLANSLWTVGRRQEAVEHLWDMLRLNPGDNQGVRYTLAGFLLFLDRDEDLARLLAQYPEEGSATWMYTKALLAFRQHGDTSQARRLLKEARKANKHVPDYVTGRKYPPEEPAYYSPGQESEAVSYVAGFLAAWKYTPGAVAWLRANEAKTGKRGKASPGKGPLSMVKKWLNDHLFQEEDVWQADFRPMATWIPVGGDPVRPWLILVSSRSNDLVLAHNVVDEPPARNLVWDMLVHAMRQPAAGPPHRPSLLEVRSHEYWDELRPHLEAIGVQVHVTEELDHVTALVADLSAHMSGQREPGLLDVPGVTPEQVGRFYEAAAAFFEQMPWKTVGFEAAIKVECDRFESGPWYAVLMGQSGLSMGLVLYEDLGTLRRMWGGDANDEHNARESVSTSVTFEEEWGIPVADLEAAKRYGWKVARPDAYPEAMHKDRGMSRRPPLAWELELLEGCLRAVPGFVERRRQDDPTREEVTVPLGSGELKLGLSWVVEVGG
jgi:tetratricopeptide (TPR) repeat protein